MARPRLPASQQRRHQVNIRLRDAELAELERRASAARMPIHDYVRRRALSDRLRVVPPRRLGAAEFREVRRLAVNVNQIARALNVVLRRFGPPAEPLTPEEVRRLEKLDAMLRAPDAAERDRHGGLTAVLRARNSLMRRKEALDRVRIESAGLLRPETDRALTRLAGILEQLTPQKRD